MMFSHLHFVVLSMLHQSYRQSVIQFLLTAVTACALTLMTSETANATCGDYLSHAGQQADVRTDLLNPSDSIPKQLPCSGPQCQNRQPGPAPEAPLIVFTSFKPACSAFTEAPAPRARQGISSSSAKLILPADHRDRIDRPPQFVGS